MLFLHSLLLSWRFYQMIREILRFSPPLSDWIYRKQCNWISEWYHKVNTNTKHYSRLSLHVWFLTMELLGGKRTLMWNACFSVPSTRNLMTKLPFEFPEVLAFRRNTSPGVRDVGMSLENEAFPEPWASGWTAGKMRLWSICLITSMSCNTWWLSGK